jgi:hypothetical protein
MSDTTSLDLMSKREREIDADIQMHLARAAGATAVRDELRELIASLSRKPRTRKVRGTDAATTEPTPSTEPDAAPKVPWPGFISVVGDSGPVAA